MGNLARKIIEGLQQTMLDRLAIRLVPMLWLYTLWARLAPQESGVLTLPLLLGGFVLFVVFWALGMLADQPPKPHRRTPYDSLHESPSNGFSAWDRTPGDGLRPPGLMRRVVMTLGARNASRGALVELLLFFAALALAWLLSHKPEAFWADIHPRLAPRHSRELLFLAASSMALLLITRSWATEQRQRLEPFVQARPPRFGPLVFLVVFAAFMGMILSDLIGFSLLTGVIGGLTLSLIGVLPPWRRRVVDVLFGRPDTPIARGRGS